MSSIFTGVTAARIACSSFKKVWLSWTTRGLNPELLPSGENLAKAALEANRYDLNCQLINCGHADQATQSLEILKSHIDHFGVYANSSKFKENEMLQKFESVDDLHHHHSKEISALEYSTFAKTWIDMGSKVIGGCCGTTPEHIRMILENSLSRSDIS
jgi:S-methylmethionine-dependent homocysteine/selenocysteine methylase